MCRIFFKVYSGFKIFVNIYCCQYLLQPGLAFSRPSGCLLLSGGFQFEVQFLPFYYMVGAMRALFKKSLPLP